LLEPKLIKLYQGKEKIFQAEIVIGADAYPTPTGTFKAGDWEKDKTNTEYGPVPWSESPWRNPYGPWFLRILYKDGSYTKYGIHGTRGPGWYWDPEPPIPESEVLKILQYSKQNLDKHGINIDETHYTNFQDQIKYLYHSHGCIRLSNRDIQQLHDLIPSPDGIDIVILSRIP
jgi:lipoprotein-anchoring transpeptidase ErfK/SrfK